MKRVYSNTKTQIEKHRLIELRSYISLSIRQVILETVLFSHLITLHCAEEIKFNKANMNQLIKRYYLIPNKHKQVVTVMVVATCIATIVIIQSYMYPIYYTIPWAHVSRMLWNEWSKMSVVLLDLAIWDTFG